MSRIFVTGANGFIGSHLVEHLEQEGHEVLAMVRKGSDRSHLARTKAEVRHASLDDPGAMAAAMEGAELVIHVAGLTAGRTPEDYQRVNGQGTANLFAAVRAATPGPRRVVLVSSLAAAGPSDPQVPRREHHRPEPISTYGKSKAMGEQEAWKAAQAGADVVIVRPPAVYGPRDEDFLQVVDLARRGLVLRLGFRDSWFSIIHSADLVRGILLAALHGRPLPQGVAHALSGQGKERADRSAGDPSEGQGIYHFGDGGRYSWAELGREAARAWDRRPWTVSVPLPLAWALAVGSEFVGRLRGVAPIFNRDKVREGGASGWWVDHGRAERELGYSPGLPYREGIASLIDHLRSEGR